MAVRRVPPLAIRWGLLLLVVCALLASFTIAASVPQGTGMAPSDERGLQKIMAMLGTARKTLLRLLGIVQERECAAGGESAGFVHLRNPLTSHSTATSAKDRQRLRLRGLLPAGTISLSTQVESSMRHLRSLPRDIDKYAYLQTLQDNYEALYFAILMAHTEECMPLVYTPTVGQACLEWHTLHRHTPKGLYLSLDDVGHVREALANWPQKTVKAVVVTDGERILGLGDLGVNGMGIPVGKLALYVACGGIRPEHTLAVQLDTGTNNEGLRGDPAYQGLRQARERSHKYDALVAELVEAVQHAYGPHTLLQFEDFGNQNAFRLLERHRHSSCSFNDDIQGTAAVVLAGLVAAQQLTGRRLAEERVLFYGAGEAGAGIADLLAAHLATDPLDPAQVQEGRKEIFLMDSKGLLVASRADAEQLAHHKLNYLKADAPACTDLLHCVRELKPTVLIGVAAVAGAFTQEVVEAMVAVQDALPHASAGNRMPVVMALSNPTSKAECTAEQAYTWAKGRVVFASGSPMPGTTIDGKQLKPGQGNNAYIFPGLGLAAVAAGARRVTDASLLAAAEALAEQVTEEQLAAGTVYPPLSSIREVSLHIADRVATHMHEAGDATARRPPSMAAHLRALAYDPLAP